MSMANLSCVGQTLQIAHVTMIWSVCKWCRKRFTSRSDKGSSRQSDECFNEVAFACCNEVIPEIEGVMIVSANAASRIIAKDVLLMLWQFSVDNCQVVYLGYLTTIAKNLGESADIFELH